MFKILCAKCGTNFTPKIPIHNLCNRICGSCDESITDLQSNYVYCRKCFSKNHNKK